MIEPYYKSDDGQITLYCADCLDVMREMEAGSVDAVVTDPPYLVGAVSIGNAQAKSGTWADLNNAAFWFSAWYREGWRTLVTGREHFATFCNWRTQPLVICAMAAAGMSATSCLVWHKAWIGPAAKNALRPTYELVVIASGGEADILDRGLSDIWTHKWMACHSADTEHPAEKPVGLLAKLTEALSIDGSTILDPFMGSGTTGVACVKTGRRFIGIEINEPYCEIAKKRIIDTKAQGMLGL